MSQRKGQVSQMRIKKIKRLRGSQKRQEKQLFHRSNDTEEPGVCGAYGRWGEKQVGKAGGVTW